MVHWPLSPMLAKKDACKSGMAVTCRYFDSMILSGQYRTIDDLVRNETQGGGSMELISLKEIRDGEEKIE